MQTKNVLTVLASAALAFSAAPSFAAGNGACPSGTPVATSYSATVEQQTDKLLRDVQPDAQRTRHRAARLQSFFASENHDWLEHTEYLAQIREEINKMGETLCSLQALRGGAAPWQQTAIDKMESQVREMAIHTQQAIQFSNNNRLHMWDPTYEGHVNNIYREACALTRTLDDSINYARVQKQYKNLKQDLGIHAGS